MAPFLQLFRALPLLSRGVLIQEDLTLAG